MEDIQNKATANTTLKPSDVSKGKGLGYILAAVDRACANLDKISRVMKKARNNTSSCSMDCDAEFIEAGITFNETKEYPYLFNVVAFNDTTMEWIVVSRVRMNKQDLAYCL